MTAVLLAFALLAPGPTCDEPLKSASDALARRDIREAEMILKAAAADCSEKAEYFELLGATRGSQGNLGGAEDAFKRAAGLNPKSARLQADLGVASLQNNHVDAGMSALEKSVALGSSDPRVLFTLGSWYGQRGAYQKAVKLLERIAPSDADEAVNFDLGLAYSHLREFEQARRAYFKTIDQKPGYAEAYFRVGVDYAAAAEPRKAIPWLFRARELSQGRTDIAYVLVEQLLRLKYIGTAEEITGAVQPDAGDPLLLVALGDIAEQKGDHRAAVSQYEAALAQQPRLAAAMIGLAEVAIASGDEARGEAYLQQALAADPSNPAALGQLGILQGHRGNWGLAATQLVGSWQADQSNLTIGLELARALRRLNRAPDALSLLSSLRTRMQDSTPFHLELAAAYAQLHQDAEAKNERAVVARLQFQEHEGLRFEDSQVYVH